MANLHPKKKRCPWCPLQIAVSSNFSPHLGLSENRVYSQWNSHLIGIMIINHWVWGFSLFSDTPIFLHTSSSGRFLQRSDRRASRLLLRRTNWPSKGSGWTPKLGWLTKRHWDFDHWMIKKQGSNHQEIWISSGTIKKYGFDLEKQKNLEI